MTADPPRRADGRCARPGCEKLLRPPGRLQRGIDPRIYEREPFCSMECCRAFHGAPLPERPNLGRKAVYTGAIGQLRGTG